MDISSSVDGIVSKVSGLGKDLSILTGGAGFLLGADSKWMSSNVGTSYPFNTIGITDMLQQIGVPRGTLNSIFGSNNVSTANPGFTFNLGSVFNSGTFLAIGLSILKDVYPNKYTKLLYNVGFAPALGYGIGRIFDDPPGSTITSAGPFKASPPVANGMGWR